jgi:hypothetical protein
LEVWRFTVRCADQLDAALRDRTGSNSLSLGADLIDHHDL